MHTKLINVWHEVNDIRQELFNQECRKTDCFYSQCQYCDTNKQLGILDKLMSDIDDACNKL